MSNKQSTAQFTQKYINIIGIWDMVVKCIAGSIQIYINVAVWVILREGGGGGWHFFEINILTLKMLEINNLSSSGKKINKLILTCWNLGEKCKIFQTFSARFARNSSISNNFHLASLAFNYNMFTRDSSISNFSGSLRSHLIITWMFDFVYYTSLFISTRFLPSCCFIIS